MADQTAATKYLTPDASGGSSSSRGKGGLFGLHLPDLGVGELIHEIGSIPGSLVRLGAAQLPGGEPAGGVASAMGKGIASSFVGTGLNALDVGSLGTLHGYTDSLRNQWGDILGGEQYAPKSLMEMYNQRGILPVAVENIGNVAAGASAASKLAGLSEVGTAANAAAAASRAAEAGWAAEDIARATQAAKAGARGFREAGISSEALKLAGKTAAKAEGLSGLDPAAVASRAKLLNVLHDVSHPYRSFFNGVLSPLGRAATDSLTADAQGTALGAEAPAAGAALDASTAKPGTAAEAPAATQAAQAATEPASTVAPVPDVHQKLLDAMAEAVAASSTGDASAREVALLDARRAAALQGIKPADQVTLYRGQAVGDLPGEHWTTDPKEAQSHATASGGHVLETVVPKEVAERAQASGVSEGHFGTSGAGSHLLPTYWADLSHPVAGSATAAVDSAATITDALAAKAAPAAAAVTEAPNTLGLSAPGAGPVQEAIQRSVSVPTPEWAAKTVAKLPTPVVRALSRSDRFIAARQTGMVLKERLRMQDVNRREILNSEAFVLPRHAAQQYLVGKVLEDGTKITPTIADNLIGDELIARLTETSAIEDAVVRHATPAAMADIRRVMVESGARAEQSIPTEWLRDADGVPTELGGLVDQTIEHLRNAATERTNILLSTSGKGLEHAADMMPALSARGQAMMRSATDDLRAIAKLERSTIPRDRILAAREMARLQDELKQVSIELRGAHAAAKDASRAFDVTRSPVKDGIVGKFNDAKEGIAATDVGGLNERIAPTPLQRAQSTPDVGGLTEHGAYRRGIEGGRAVEDMRTAAVKAAELERSRVALAKNLDEIKRTLIEHQLPSEVMRDKLAARADRRITATARQLEHPALGGVPTQWKPMWDSITKLHKEAAFKPDLQEALAEVPHSWNTVLKIAAEQGFNPEHVRSFQPSEVRKLVYDSVSLGYRGRDLGQTIEAGTRKTRIAAQARTRSLSALAAGIVEATHEGHTNALAKFIDDTWAKPVVGGIIPAHGVAWDPARSFLLTGQKTSMGDTLVQGLGAPTKWIPREVKAVLDAYQRDYHHGSFEFIRKATDPWRLLVLTLSPRWYVNNFMGNVLLATKEGVHFQDWAAAWKEFKQGGTDLTRNRFMRKVGAGTDSFRDVSGAVAGGLRNERAPESLVAYARGTEGLRQAVQEGGTMEAGRLLQHRLNRANEVVDEMARVAVYKSQLRRGATVEHALNRVYASMVDYNDMSPFERQFVRSVVPFYAWQKAILKIVTKFPIDNPAVTGILLSLDKVNRDLAADQFGGDVPEYYRGIVAFPGIGNVNTRPFNPFADAGALSSPQGIAGSVNPFVSIAMRNALGAPDGASYQRTDQFGRRVSDTSPAQDLTEVAASLPQLRVGQAATGTTITGQPQGLGPAVGGFLGLRTYSDENIQAMIDRMAKASKTTKKPSG